MKELAQHLQAGGSAVAAQLGFSLRALIEWNKRFNLTAIRNPESKSHDCSAPAVMGSSSMSAWRCRIRAGFPVFQ
jgi:hypothetical protein